MKTKKNQSADEVLVNIAGMPDPQAEMIVSPVTSDVSPVEQSPEKLNGPLSVLENKSSPIKYKDYCSAPDKVLQNRLRAIETQINGLKGAIITAHMDIGKMLQETSDKQLWKTTDMTAPEIYACLGFSEASVSQYTAAYRYCLEQQTKGLPVPASKTAALAEMRNERDAVKENNPDVHVPPGKTVKPAKHKKRKPPTIDADPVDDTPDDNAAPIAAPVITGTFDNVVIHLRLRLSNDDTAIQAGDRFNQLQIAIEALLPGLDVEPDDRQGFVKSLCLNASFISFAQAEKLLPLMVREPVFTCIEKTFELFDDDYRD